MYGYSAYCHNKSPLPLTNPRAHRVVHRCRRSVW